MLCSRDVRVLRFACAHVVAEGKGICQAGTQRCIGRSFEGWVNLKLLQLPRKFPYHHPSFWSFRLLHPFSEKQFATQAHSSWVYVYMFIYISMYITPVLASVCNGGLLVCSVSASVRICLSVCMYLVYIMCTDTRDGEGHWAYDEIREANATFLN